MKISRSIATLMLAGAAGAFALTSVGTAEAKLKSITVGSNPAGSTYFLFGRRFRQAVPETA